MSPDGKRRTHAVALALWLSVQLATLAIGAARTPLWARSNFQPQKLALPEMVIVQMTLATLLFPSLLSEGTTAAVVITGLPFIALAGFLSSTPTKPLIIVSIATCMWFCGLRLWSAAIASNSNRHIATAVLNCVLIGSPVLDYVVQEFSDDPSKAGWNTPSIVDPLNAIVTEAFEPTSLRKSCAAPASLLITGALAWALRHRRISRDRLSTSISA